MKSNKRKYFLVFPLISASLCLWQVRRYYEKKELIRNIEEAYYYNKGYGDGDDGGDHMEITSLEQLKEKEYHRVQLNGILKESFMVGPKVKKGYGLGYYVHDTVEFGGGGGVGVGNDQRVVVVNRGFVPENRMQEYYDTVRKKDDVIRGVVYDQKYFMPSRMFRQTGATDTETFIHLDTQRMGSQSEYFIMELSNVDAEEKEEEDRKRIPIRSDGLLNVPNKHLEYIATWGLLTAALLGMIFK